jgi:hypothetical protein
LIFWLNWVKSRWTGRLICGPCMLGDNGFIVGWMN